jgi:hypothetical protein
MAVQLRLEFLAGPDAGASVDLIALDGLICKALGVPVHPSDWCHNWMNTIGLALATGASWDKAREYFSDSADLLRIVDYLESSFTNASHSTR